MYTPVSYPSSTTYPTTASYKGAILGQWRSPLRNKKDHAYEIKQDTSAMEKDTMPISDEIFIKQEILHAKEIRLPAKSRADHHQDSYNSGMHFTLITIKPNQSVAVIFVIKFYTPDKPSKAKNKLHLDYASTMSIKTYKQIKKKNFK